MYGNKLKKLRKEAGLAQEDIAHKTGFPQSSVSNWEKAQYPPLDFIVETLKIVKPEMKLWEFFLEDDADLKDYVPLELRNKPGLMEFIKQFDRFEPEDQEYLITAFGNIIKIFLDNTGNAKP